MRALASRRAVLALAALVVCSTAARWAVAQRFTVPWIAPDEMLYALIGESLWSAGALDVRGLPSPYYSLLVPALIGAPFAWADDLGRAIDVAQLLQALAMSLAAVPVFLWTRRLAPTGHALAAAALVLLPPGLWYAGFLMSEPLSYTLVAVALAALARAVEEPTLWRQGVFVLAATFAGAVRLQALVLLPAFLVAIVLEAASARSRDRLRRLLPLVGLTVLAVALVVGAVAALRGGLSREDVLGAYSPIGTAPARSAGAFSAIAWQVVGLAAMTLVVPLLATVALAAPSLRGRETDAPVRAFVATTTAYVALLVLQVGLFASEYVGHVAERYLVTAVPPLVVGLCVWVARGGRCDRAVVLPAAGVLLLLAALVPEEQIVSALTLPSSFTTAVLGELGDGADVRIALLGLVALAAAVVAAVPGRLAWVSAAAVALGWAALSAYVVPRIDEQSAHEQRVNVSSAAPSWLDDAGLRDVTLLATDRTPWPALARTVFWNRGVRGVVRLPGVAVPVPPGPSPEVEIAPDGTLVSTADGGRLERPIVVVPASIDLDGEAVATRPADDSEADGLTAWRLDRPARVTLRREGFLPNGDFTGPARVTVYGCGPGELLVTVIGKSGDPVDVSVDGLPVATLETPAETTAGHRVPAPPYADGTRECLFDLRTAGFAGTTTIAFLPESG